MVRASLSTLLLALAVITIMFSSIVPSHAVMSYVPAVSQGQGAEYKVVEDVCQPQGALACTLYPDPLGGLDYALIEVVNVSGNNITLSLVSAYKDGTATRQGALVNVETGALNITFAGVITNDELVLAGNLQASQPIWTSIGAPTLNQTVNEQLLGSARWVNFLNTTTARSYSGETVTVRLGLAFDRASGILVGAIVHATGTGSAGSFTVDAALIMVDNNIWTSSSLLNFAFVVSPVRISSVSGSDGKSVISLVRNSGFTGPVDLTLEDLSSAISCSLGSSRLAVGADSTTLSCSGPTGTYPVTVKGDSGFSVNTVTVTLQVSDFLLSSDGPVSFQTGSAGDSTITLTGVNGFDSTVNLSVTSSPSGLNCQLGFNSLTGPGKVVMTCTGEPGSYQVTVTATIGSLARSTQATVHVTAAPASFLPFGTGMLLLYSGIIAVVIVAAIFIVFLRKRPAN